MEWYFVKYLPFRVTQSELASLVVITTLHILMFSFFFLFFIVIIAFGYLSNNIGFSNQCAASHVHELLNTLYFICMIFFFWLCAVCFGLGNRLVECSCISPFCQRMSYQWRAHCVHFDVLVKSVYFGSPYVFVPYSHLSPTFDYSKIFPRNALTLLCKLFKKAFSLIKTQA